MFECQQRISLASQVFFVNVKGMTMIVMSASHRGYVDWLSWAGDECVCFVVEQSPEHHEGQLQVTKAVYFQDKYSNDKRDCDAALLIEPI